MARQLKVEYRPIAKLKPYAGNANVHPPEQIDKIKASLKRFGWTNPILVDGKNGVVAGHGRLQAALQLEQRTVPVIELTGLTQAEKRAYVLADNRIAQDAGWDKELLATEFSAMKAMGLDLTLTGFDLGEIDALLSPSPSGPAEPPVPALPTHAISKLGDVWVLGNHRLACGDNTEESTWKALMRGQAAHLVHTDPPYGVSYQGLGLDSSVTKVIKGDDLRRGQLAKMVRTALAAAKPHVRGNAAWYIWHASNTRQEFDVAIREVGLIEPACGYIVWIKPMTMGWTDYRSAFEPCYYLHLQGEQPAFYGERDSSTVWRLQPAPSAADEITTGIGPGLTLTTEDGRELHITASQKGKKTRHVHVGTGPVFIQDSSPACNVWEAGRERLADGGGLHPTQKPVALARRALMNSSQEGEIVVDFFSGSGSTIIAAEQLNRAAYAMDLDPIYVDVAVQRWQLATGKEAINERTGKTYASTPRQKAKARTKAKA